jgi:deoxycytidylate deaminase
MRKRRIVSIEHNWGWRHAEKRALAKVSEEIKGQCDLWSIRVNKLGNLALAKPCENCQILLRASGIKNVYFSNNAGEIEFMRLD